MSPRVHIPIGSDVELGAYIDQEAGGGGSGGIEWRTLDTFNLTDTPDHTEGGVVKYKTIGALATGETALLTYLVCLAYPSDQDPEDRITIMAQATDDPLATIPLTSDLVLDDLGVAVGNVRWIGPETPPAVARHLAAENSVSLGAQTYMVKALVDLNIAAQWGDADGTISAGTFNGYTLVLPA